MIEDFTSGTDKIDVSGAMKDAGVGALVFTDRFTGRAGEAMLKHDPRTGLSSLAIDLKGTGNADLVVKSKGEIKPADVQGGGKTPNVQPLPTPTPAPAPAPLQDKTLEGAAGLIQMFAITLLAFFAQLISLITSPSGQASAGKHQP